MNIDDVWNFAGNSPSAVDRDALVGHTRATIRRLQQRRVAFIVWTATALGAATAMAGYAWVSGRAELGGVWPVLLLLTAQWMMFGHFLKEALTGRRTVALTASIREALERLGREVEEQRRNQIAMLALFAVATPLVAASIVHLREAGKMARHEALSAGVLFGVIVSINLAVILVRRYRVVLPRRRRLAALLLQYRPE